LHKPIQIFTPYPTQCSESWIKYRMLRHFLGDQKKLDSWLDNPHFYLYDRTPRELLDAEEYEELAYVILLFIGA
jgi:hypothetical protein